jgi:hypothetical protein
MLYARVRALQAVVAHRCKYNLRCAAAPRDRDVVDYFLFDLQEGYCDSFAAALTMLCRYDGIPARMASGFITGDSEGGAFVVRDKDRHMWTEVYFPGVGWVPFDATEGSQDITPVGDDASSRVNVLVTWFRSQGWGPRAAGLALIVLFAYLIKTELLPRIPRLSRRRDPQHARMEAVVAAYAAACTALSRRGLRRRVTDTPDEFMARVASRHGAASPDVALAFQRLTDNHARCCYGPAAPGDRDIREAALALAALRAALREVRGTLGDTPERPRRRIRTLRPSETGQ